MYRGYFGLWSEGVGMSYFWRDMDKCMQFDEEI